MREMKSIKLSVIYGAVLGISIVCSTALGQVAGMDKHAIAGALPPPVMPPDEIPPTPVEKLGKFMLYDHTLSNPSGYACATCHVPEAGFTGPDSLVNLFGGPQPGVVPGRFSNRKPQSYVYAAFCPVGPVFNANLGVWLGGDFWDALVPDLSGQAKMPAINPNEMANTPVGPYPPLQGGYSPLLAEKLKNRPYTTLFPQNPLNPYYQQTDPVTNPHGFDPLGTKYIDYAPLFPPPEVLDNVQNVAGVTPAQATGATESNGQVGNLQLSAEQEQDLVNFLSILSDGFIKPNSVSP